MKKQQRIQFHNVRYTGLYVYAKRVEVAVTLADLHDVVFSLLDRIFRRGERCGFFFLRECSKDCIILDKSVFGDVL